MQLELSQTKSFLSEEEIIKLRDKFVSLYCENKGWDKSNLEFEQVYEIRSHSQWKNPYMING